MQEKDVLLGVLEYHYRENLSRILPYIENGVFFDPSPIHPGPVVIGKENKNIKPCFVLINGTTLKTDLRKSSIIEDNNIEYSDVSSQKDFVDYLFNIKDEDGAAIFEEYSRMGFLGILKFKESVNLDYTFPDKYLSDVEEVDVPLSRLGGRTLAAAGIVQKFSYARACIVKSTGVNETSTGSISYFGPNGLEEEIIFRHAPELRNQTYKQDGQEHPYTYLDDGTSIMGVHRKYTKIDGNFVLLDEQYIGMSGGSFVLQPSANEYSSIEDSLTSPLPQSGAMPGGYRSEIEGLVSGIKKVGKPCYSN